jgi:prepilin-type N-terminal cleavage/methylation domain-containing protein
MDTDTLFRKALRRRARHRARPHRHGFTLVEILIALMVTGMVGVAVATMIGAVGRGTQNGVTERRQFIQQQVLRSRLGPGPARQRPRAGGGG